MSTISIPNMTVLFGPPGCGKTTELSRLVHQYAEDDGPDTLLLCSYTKTGARELAGRGLPLQDGQIGTLHSHCFQGLDHPSIAESQWKQWNELYPYYQLSAQADRHGAMPDESPGHHDALQGDTLLHEVTVLRSRLVAPDRWHATLQQFWRTWKAWKVQQGLLDFTDLLERATQVLPVAPGRPKTIIIDEAQDLSLLMWTLIQSWAQHATRVIAAGDDDQALYRWVGGDFRPLLACTTKRVLPQSYRIPQAVQAYAGCFTDQICTRERKAWQARPDVGSVSQIFLPWDQPSQILAQLHPWLEDRHETAMCIVTCGYMLEPLITLLRAEGVPFSNRWRRRNRSWNPLAPPTHGISTAQRLTDFLRPMDRLWTWQELATWLPLIHSEQYLRRGAKKQMTLHAEERGICPLATLETLFKPEALPGALTGGLPWFESAILQSKATQLAYPLRVYRRHGRLAFEEEPRLTMGSAHSLKGAEADRVMFWPTLSRGQQIALGNGGDEADDIWRMRYVGATRAKQTLTVCAPVYGIAPSSVCHAPDGHVSDYAEEEIL